ncbi:MAG: hypothetical protein HY046_13650 [Acidobacteria bacterium]|nr:hypothetical protein [Acidobacteriota bacterium]
MRLEMDRVQRLTAEIGAEARIGDLSRVSTFVESRIRQEFELADVRVVLADAPSNPYASAGRVERFPLHKQGGEDLGTLEVYFHGAHLSGETQAALEFLAEQLPAAIDLCRLIEEKVRLERELAERERLALLGQMAATISHNLKNPLSSMKTVMQVQLENPNLPESIRKDSELVVGEIDRLSGKLSQLLQYSKPSLRNGSSAQVIDAGAITDQIISLLKHDAGRRGIALDLHRSAGPLSIAASEEAFSDVLTNLVVNAIEAVKDGGLVAVTMHPREGGLLIEVIDNGQGIPSGLREKILRPFFTTKAKGTGLGLAIAQKRLAEMNGTMSWDSPVANGRGTRFAVTLPLAP